MRNCSADSVRLPQTDLVSFRGGRIRERGRCRFHSEDTEALVVLEPSADSDNVTAGAEFALDADRASTSSEPTDAAAVVHKEIPN